MLIFELSSRVCAAGLSRFVSCLTADMIHLFQKESENRSQEEGARAGGVLSPSVPPQEATARTGQPWQLAAVNRAPPTGRFSSSLAVFSRGLLPTPVFIAALPDCNRTPRSCDVTGKEHQLPLWTFKINLLISSAVLFFCTSGVLFWKITFWFLKYFCFDFTARDQSLSCFRHVDKLFLIVTQSGNCLFYL